MLWREARRIDRPADTVDPQPPSLGEADGLQALWPAGMRRMRRSVSNNNQTVMTARTRAFRHRSAALKNMASAGT
jgi:hypothetical protein